MLSYKITNWVDHPFSISMQCFLNSTKIQKAYKLGNPRDRVVAFSFQTFFSSHVVFPNYQRDEFVLHIEKFIVAKYDRKTLSKYK